jgi:hypothetical protein
MTNDPAPPLGEYNAAARLISSEGEQVPPRKTLKPAQLLVDLLDAAGYDLAPHRDGQSWVATHRDTGQQVEGEDPGPVARDALALLRQQLADVTRELENARAQAEDAARQLAQLTQGERGA